MKVIVFGGTGMVGSEVLDLCLSHSDVTQVVTIGRNKTGFSHPKLKEVEHSNFLDFSSLEAELSDADICYYCVGVYQGQVSKSVFWQVTVDYLNALLLNLEKGNPNIRFCLFSSQGANQKESSLMLFANAKGRAEAMLSKSRLRSKYIFRPGYIAPSRVSTVQTLSAKFFYPVYKLLPFIGIDAHELAKVMVYIGLTGRDDKVFENSEIRKLSQSI